MGRNWLGGVFLAAFLSAPAPAEPTTGAQADREEASFNKSFKPAPVADEYLKSIVERLTTAAQRPEATPIRVRAVRADWPFVFALDNGATYVSTGLLARLENDSQVASLIAPEIASVVAPNTERQANFDEKQRRHLGPKLLAVIATAGIAAFPITSSENKAYSALQDAIILDNDKTGLGWARAAGFDVSQAPFAAQRLRELLAAENLSGSNRLANSSGLDARAAQLTKALQELPVDLNTRPPSPDPAEPLQSLAKRLSIDLVYYDFEHSHREGIVPLLDRIDRQFGQSADSACLRARYLRESPTSSQVTQQVIDAYETCVAAPGASEDNLKQLAFLYRDKGDAAAATKAFEKYLKLAPQAVDAPIIKMYIEELRATR
ncbi:MAG TPA: M48 family metalloprotease [Steroidobacteraceae bacterium]|nr:M48 family metalloprotease [Steroidobacteraceae bacterium]